MIARLRKSFALKVISIFMVLTIITQWLSPMKAYALTSGPSQPEVHGFEPIGTSDMVDLFSGDFTYNIPLMDVDGYPINLSYHSGVSMDQEASWVGLGWSLNPGVVNRSIRGLPDDFSEADKITKETNVRPDQTFRVDLGMNGEIVDLPLSVNVGLGIYYNNYRGMGYSLSAGANMDIGPMNLGAQLGFDTEQGIDFSPSLSLTLNAGKTENGDKTVSTEGKVKGGVSMGFNSRGGLKELSFSASYYDETHDAQYKTVKNEQGKDVQVRDGYKKNASGVSRGFNGGGGISFANPTYSPNVQAGSYQYAITLSGKFGGSVFAVDPSFTFSVSYSEHGISGETREYSSYGYLYADKGAQNHFGMQDVTREKEGGFNKFKKYLPLSSHAYDIYSVSGQGTGGTIRPYRGNIGTLFDARAENENWPSVNLSLEAGGGPPPSGKIGGNIKVAWSDVYSGLWTQGNNSLSMLTFLGETAGSTFEPVYFKNAGEKSINDFTFYNKYGGEKAVRVALDNSVDDARALPYFLDNNGTSYPLNNPISRGTTRDKRNMCVSYLTADVANNYALDKMIRNYTRNANGGPEYDGNNFLEYTTMYRLTPDRKANHISEITSLNPDGTRYVYGIPAYNYVHFEKTFNVNDATVTCSTGLVDYSTTPGAADNSLDNEKGVDYYYSATKMPPYAHSYLLTSVLSPDYIDVTGNGPSDDDYGKYTRFNYACVNTKDDPYQWRSPFYDANHNEGFKSDDDFEAGLNMQDDKGSYVYGEKEVWHLSSIETKNYIAEFYTSPRTDAYGVKIEDQNNPSYSSVNMGETSFKLDSIRLLSKQDILENGSSATPIKVVHFEYDYTLCKAVTNNSVGSNSGKLTLKRLWFTYGNSSRGSLNKYEFSYGNLADANENPNYSMKSYDRWGNYKPNSTNCSDLQNSDFPYVDQDKDALVDKWAAAWHLKSITLPSGGEITIEYESDDYAYVQNKEAMQMIKILGFDTTASYNSTYPHKDELFLTSFMDITPQRFLFFKAPVHFSAPNDQAVEDMYFRDMDVLYYNFLTNLTGEDPDERSDYIAGYCEFDSVGYVNDSIGYIAIKQQPLGDRESIDQLFKIHPASKAALQYLRVNRSDLAYPPEQPNFNPSIFDIVGVVAQFFLELKTLILGFNRDRMLDGYAKDVNLEKSWIRLHEPSYHKKGGGSRVSKIEFSDQWDNMTGSTETDASYGQTYSYEITENGITKSSGVASYEPALGGDENPWKQPIKYEEVVAGAPNNDYYVETPLGESYFPGPSVGYRRVEVTNIKRTGVRRHATGKTVHEFYTAAEFPTITRNTDIQAEMHKPWSPLSFFGLLTEEYATASQGYCIELNDMHGKPKAQWVYSEIDNLTPISGVEYKYKVINDAVVADLKNNETKLSNTATVLLPNGTYTTKVIGEEIDMVVDANEKHEMNYVVGAQVNLDGFMLFIIPIALPLVLPDFSFSNTRIKTIVATKVINRYGILEKTIAHDNGATLETQNIAWDSETGEVLLTRVQNEYRDNTFNLTYPVHWAYDKGMGQAYKNINQLVTFTTNASGYVSSNPTLASLLVPGDELAIISPASMGSLGEKLWVLDVNGNDISFVFRNGTKPQPSTSFTCRVIRSGRRNMQTLPLMTISSRNTPLYSGRYEHDYYDTANVLNSSAAEYSQDWQMYPTVCESGEPRDTSYSSFLSPRVYNYYVTLVNQLIEQERLFTNGSTENILDVNYWPNSLMNDADVNTTLLNAVCNSDYLSDDTSGTISGTVYPAIKFRFDLDDPPCTWSTLWSKRYYAYSTKDSSQVGMDFYNDIDYLIPGAYYDPGNNIPAGISSLAPSGTAFTFYLTAKMNNGSYLPLFIALMDNYDPDMFITSSPIITNNIFCCPTDSVVNPYIWNLRGNWRLLRNFVYFDKRDTSYQRTQAITGYNYNTTNTRTDGLFINYVPLWYLNSSTWTLGSYNTANSPWVWQTMITQHSPYMELENKDALNIYSSALLSYNFTLPTAVAKNAMLRQIAYDGFEDYELTVPEGCQLQEHFNFKGEFGSAAVLETTTVHTGKYSLRVDNGEYIAVTKTIDTTSYTTWTPSSLLQQFKYKKQHLVSQFSPLGTGTYNYGNVVAKAIDGKYILSYWVSASSIHSLPTDLITIKINGSTSVTLNSTGNDQVVENWKRIERSFTIPANTTSIEVKLNNTHSAYIYYDDIRIQPLKSSMVTYVYDIITQRLTAQLDDNNYATFYEYDVQGNLIRIKKETERGIMTIQESNQNMAH